MDELGIKVLDWNFSEPAHGKSPADSAGGNVKRAANDLITVAKSDEFNIINNAVEFVEQVKQKTVVHVNFVPDNALDTYKKYMTKVWKKSLPKMRSLRQIVIDSKTQTLYCRMYSCAVCLVDHCTHYPGAYELSFTELRKKCANSKSEK